MLRACFWFPTERGSGRCAPRQAHRDAARFLAIILLHLIDGFRTL